MAAKVTVGFDVDTMEYFFKVEKDGETYSKCYVNSDKDGNHPEIFAEHLESFLNQFACEFLSKSERHDFVIDTMLDVAMYLIMCLEIPERGEYPAMISVTEF